MSDPATEAERAWQALLAAFRAFADLVPGGSWSEAPAIAISRCPSLLLPLLNGVWVLGDAVVDDVAAAVAALEAERLPGPIIVRQGRTPDVEAAAPDMGLSHDEKVPFMVTRPEELIEEDIEGVELIEAVGEGAWSQAQRLAELGYELPEAFLSAMYRAPVAGTPELSITLARVDGVPVSTAQTFVVDDVVGVYSVATPPEHRGRGYAGALTAWATARSFVEGATFAYLQSSAMGESVYRRIGFRDVDAFTIFGRPDESD